MRFTPGRRLLDFGTGVGALVHEALNQGFDAVGLDLNRGLVQAANQYWGFKRLRCERLDDFTKTNQGAFDAIMCNQVFEHIRKPVDVGRTLVSLLKPQGVLYVDVPNARQLAEWFARGGTFDPTSDFNHFTLATLKKLVTRIGCHVVYASAAPSLIGVYRTIGLGSLCYPLGRLSRRLLPPIGSGACVIGRTGSH